MISGKIWGSTELIISNESLEFNRIVFKKDYACSKHKHNFKYNGFYVESGKMMIKVWQKNYDLIDETILNQGEFTMVAPGLFHQFIGIEDGVCFELYWANLNLHDIERETVGHNINDHK